MNGWKEVALGKIADFINGDRGKNYPSEGDFIDNGIPFINAGHLADGKVDFSTMNYISESRFQLLGSGKIQADDILYCLRGSLGKTAIYRENRPAAIASSLVIIRPCSECTVDYLYHFLASPLGKQEIRKFDNGSSQPNLSATSVKNYVVPLPPLHEQRRIAAILDQAEALLAKRRQALAKLDTLTQSIFIEMFGDRGKSCEGAYIDEIGNVSRRITYGFTSPMKHIAEGIPIITAKHVKRGWIDFSSVHYAERAEFEALTAKCKPAKGDVLITKDGTIGRSAVLASEEPVCINQSVALVQLDQRRIVPEYFSAFVNLEQTQRKLEAMGKGNSIRHLQITEFARLQIVVPSLNLQNEFLRRTGKLQRQKRLMELHERHLDFGQQSLQHRAFRGEL